MPTLHNAGVPSYTDAVIEQRYISHVAKIKSSSVVTYRRYYGFKTAKTEAELQNLTKGRDGLYNGFMSPATSRKVRTLLENWLQSIENQLTNNWERDNKAAFSDPANHRGYYPTFITLTLPAKQAHDDNFIKRNMLGRFIINLKLTAGVEQYFWRAEPQKNGSIHFHILVDRWIHWRSIRHDWNKIMSEYGYIDAYRKNQERWHRNGYRADVAQINARIDNMQERARAAGQKFDLKATKAEAEARARKAYDEGVKCNWSDPNSTDIHAIDKVENLTAYVVKYVSKNPDPEIVAETKREEREEWDWEKNEWRRETVTVENVQKNENRRIAGRIWGCSDGIRDLKHFEAEIATEHSFHSDVNEDSDEYRLICHLEVEAEEKLKEDPDNPLIWRDADSGTVVYRLEEKSHAVLRTLFPDLFARYSNHYRTMYGQLYGQDALRTQALPEAPKNQKQLLCSIITKIDNEFDIQSKSDDYHYAKGTVFTTPDSWFEPVELAPF